MPAPKRNLHALATETLTPPPTLPPAHKIARITKAAGNNLYHLSLPSGEALLAELPARFRSTIWVKRGTYVVVDSAALAERGNKLGGEIVNIVREERSWRKMGYWPAEFGVVKRVDAGSGSESEEDQGPRMPSDDEDEEG